MSKVLIIGGGAAGMMAAVTAAGAGHQVALYEKNEKLGKKLYITGKGRCNLTNACDTEELFESLCANKKFLYSAFYGFSNQDTIRFFAEQGLETKVERGNRVFPVSDHSSDVIRVLQRAMAAAGVDVYLNSEVKELIISERQVSGIRIFEKNSKRERVVNGEAVIVATGGLSYPVTGSTGDGYRFAGAAGHGISECSPALVPLQTEEVWVPELQGLSLRNVRAGLYDGSKCLYEDFGEMMFTHYGVTGPLILTASSRIQKQLGKKGKLQLRIDLKPALTEEQLDNRILREFAGAKNKQFKNSVDSLFPGKLQPLMIRLSGIPPEKKVNEITREERQQFVRLIKNFALTVIRLRDYNEAIVTRGGVQVKDINPATMASKLISGLYFAGEVLDLDAVTGGFNLQIAWSTGYAAGRGITE